MLRTSQKSYSLWAPPSPPPPPGAPTPPAGTRKNLYGNKSASSPTPTPHSPPLLSLLYLDSHYLCQTTEHLRACYFSLHSFPSRIRTSRLTASSVTAWSPVKPKKQQGGPWRKATESSVQPSAKEGMERKTKTGGWGLVGRERESSSGGPGSDNNDKRRKSCKNAKQRGI